MSFAQETPSKGDFYVYESIRSLLGARKMTLREFAEKCGLPYRTVQNYLAGKARIPAEFVAKACDVFSVEADYLLFSGVDLERSALVEAVASALADILPNLEIHGERIGVRSDLPRDAHRNDEKRTAVQTAIVLMISARVRDEYIAKRIEALREGEEGCGLPRRRRN